MITAALIIFAATLFLALVVLPGPSLKVEALANRRGPGIYLHLSPRAVRYLLNSHQHDSQERTRA